MEWPQIGGRVLQLAINGYSIILMDNAIHSVHIILHQILSGVESRKFHETIKSVGIKYVKYASGMRPSGIES